MPTNYKQKYTNFIESTNLTTRVLSTRHVGNPVFENKILFS